MGDVQDAFGVVIFAVVGVGVVAALGSLLLRKSTYEQIGKGGLFEDAAPRPRGDGGGGDGVTGALRDEEIRQMLTARNAIRASQGRAEVDVEAELAALNRPHIDPELEQEIRDMVVRRNARRIDKGQEPLDVEAEVARRIADLGA